MALSPIVVVEVSRRPYQYPATEISPERSDALSMSVVVSYVQKPYFGSFGLKLACLDWSPTFSILVRDAPDSSIPLVR